MSKLPRYLCFVCIFLVTGGMQATAEDVYVDLSSSFDQDGFVTGGAGQGDPLDSDGSWLDAATLAAGYADGSPFTTVDGLTTFQYGTLRGDAVDCVRIAGQTIPVPSGQYSRLHLALLATDGSMADLSRIMTLNYADGTNEEANLGPIASWYGSPTAFADSIHTFFDRSTVTEMINITPQQNDDDYIIEITGSALEARPDFRFMDGTSVLIYEFDLPDDLTEANLGIDMQNNFVVSLSKDGGANFEEVLNSFEMFGVDEHGGANRDIYNIDLVPWFEGNPGNVVLVQFTDGSTNDGWGPAVFNVAVYTGEIVKYEQRQVTEIDATNATVYADFLTDASENEAQYLFDESSQAPTGQGHRFADGSGFITYEIDLPDDVTEAKAALNINGNFVVSVGTGGDVITHVSFTPNQDDDIYIEESTGSANEFRDDFRFVDGTSVLTYYIGDIPPELTGATLNIDMQNNFVVHIAKEIQGELVFEEVLNSMEINGADVHDGSNRRVYTVSLAKFFLSNPLNELYIRFTDGSTGDGWGPAVFKVSITSGSGAEFTEVFSAVGLTETSLVPYSRSGGQDRGYYTVDLTPFLATVPNNRVLIQLTDETPSDGWGPGIYRMIVYSGDLVIRTDGSSMPGLVPTGGLPDSAYPWGANIVRREYAVNPSKTLDSITFPTLVEDLGNKLYLFAATMEGVGAPVADWSVY